jgi:glycerophosphoryl diester phosphodiesterase
MRHKGNLELRDTHVVLYSEPGKHAFAPTPDWFKERAEHFKRSETSDLAGCSGVLTTPYTKDSVTVPPLKNRLVHTYLSQHAFEPSWQFSRVFELTPEMLVPWEALRDWIPSRVNDWLARLAQGVPPSDYRFLRIGHRGARAHAPDNTLSSLRKAAELGADMVEIDVQLTADHHAVVVHDVYLTDTAGRVWPVRASMLEELQAIDLGGGEHVPTLSEALNVCYEENMGAYIELKDGAAVASVIEALREYEMQSHSIVGSFRPDWLAELKAISSKIITSILFSYPKLDAVKLAQAIDATYVHPCWERYPHPSALLNPAWIKRVREAGLGIICWHEERPQEIAALRKLGVDGICSDAPELLLPRTSENQRNTQ